MNPNALVFLVPAIASEVAGTAGLKPSEGFRRVGPSALAVLGYALAFYFLAQSLRYIPLGSPTPYGRGSGRWARCCWGADLEGGPWDDARLRDSADRGGRGGTQHRP